jgi:hypothetical protein
MANGVVLYRGPSMLDKRVPIVVIAVGIAKASTNVKTGGMIQTYIIRSDMSPIVAVNKSADAGICGGCIHRKNAKTGKRSCYVNLGHGPLAVYRAFKRRKYRDVSLVDASRIAAGRTVRFGTYGDPAAAPLAVWDALASQALGYTGYTHQWRSKRFAGLAEYCQASCETEADVTLAHKLGYTGTFRVLPIGADIPDNALHCPASSERGKLTTCAECLACNGSGTDVVLYAHGAGARNYAPKASRALPVLVS